ncbi:MAG: YggS family pyridoxal phosphate-dependent enzyme [Ignavibacteriaceae bacterium]
MIAENLKEVRRRINDKCRSVNRDPEEITLIAVSKYFGLDAITQVYDEGVLNFGENKAQELDAKFSELGDKISWHFIGNLQKNKVKYVIKSAKFIHSVTSVSLANEINKRAGTIDKIQKVLIQVKTSDEETKSGVAEEEASKLVLACREYKNLLPVGLMTMAPLTDDENLIRKSFSDLRKLRDRLNSQGFNLRELSMGMTSDFEIAIEEGATMLRIGSAIFGERDYSKNWKEI